MNDVGAERPNMPNGNMWRQILLDWGIALSNGGAYSESQEKIEQSMSALTGGRTHITPKRGLIATGHYYLALNQERCDNPDYDAALQHVRKGMAFSHPYSKTHSDFTKLEQRLLAAKEKTTLEQTEQLEQPVVHQFSRSPIVDLSDEGHIQEQRKELKKKEDAPEVKPLEVSHLEGARKELGAVEGCIRFYNTARRFGLIDAESGDTHIYFYDEAMEIIEAHKSVDGLHVSYFPRDNPKPGGTKIAVDIVVLGRCEEVTGKGFKGSWM